MLRFAFFILLICSFNPVLANDVKALHGEVQFTYSGNIRFYTSDNPKTDTPAIHVETWPEFVHAVKELDYRGIFWLVHDVKLEVPKQPILDYEYNLRMYASQEVFWNDQFIGANGVPAANIQDEIPGKTWTSYLIPNDQLTTGLHTIAIRGSDHHRWQDRELIREGWIVPFNPEFRFVSFWSLVPSLLVSIAAVVGIYFLMLYFTEGKQKEHLTFFLLLENLTILGYAIQWEHLVGYTYDLEPINLALEFGSGVATLVLLPLYFLFKHKAAKPWLWLLIATALTLSADKIFPDVQIMGWIGSFSTALIVSVYYGYKQKKLLWWESLGLLGCLFALVTNDFENVFMFFPTLFSLILLSHAITMQQRKRALQQASFIESQLRAELLKKHIQPHFLLNTLTSLMEWVETDVDRSTEFIAELAEEFRLMSKVSSQSLVDLHTELQLCEKHLAIMSLRLQKQCSLQRFNIDGAEKMPPAIFHTLIENAFSHNAYETNAVKFELKKVELENGETEYQFIAPKSSLRTSSFRKLGTGTGRQYIEARLNQSFDHHWRFEEIDEGENWKTTIVVNYKKLKLEQIELSAI